MRILPLAFGSTGPDAGGTLFVIASVVGATLVVGAAAARVVLVAPA